MKTAQEMNILTHKYKKTVEEETIRILDATVMPKIEKAAKNGIYSCSVLAKRNLDKGIATTILTSLGYSVHIVGALINITWE